MKNRMRNIFLLIVSLTIITGCTTTTRSSSEKKLNSNKLPQYTQEGWKNVRIVGGGYIPGFVFSTKQKDLIYARTDMGGAYRWNPENNSWLPLTDFVGVEDYGRLGIASIATDPVEPNRLVIAAGTYTNDWDPTNSQMLVSEDYGDTFLRVDMPFKMGGNMPGRGAGERLAIDPNSNNIIYFGSNDAGLWRSEDYGHTWAEVTSFPTPGNIYDGNFEKFAGGFRHFFGIVWVMFDPASNSEANGSQNIYAGVIDTEYTILESNDAGKTWHPLEGQLDNINPNFKLNEEGVYAQWDENPDTGKYYPIKSTYSSDGAMIISYNAGIGPYSSSFQGGAIWKYTFATKEWKDISLPKHDFDPSYVTTDRGVGSVSVQWDNPKVLVATTLNEWWPDEIIYRSTDGGENWDPIWYIDSYPERINKYSMDITEAPWLDWGGEKTLPEQSPKLGWMLTDIEIDPFNPNRMMYGTGANVHGTNNLTNWDKNKKIKIEVMGLGIEETAILDLVASPLEDGPILYSGMGDIGGFVHWDLNKSPNMIVNPQVSAINSIDYAEQKPTFVVRMGDGKLGISEDAGRTWRNSESIIPGIESGWSGQIAVSSDASTILWAPSQGKDVHYSPDTGKTWIKSQGIPSNVKIVSDRVNPNKFYAISDSIFYSSNDGARTFEIINDTTFVTENSDLKTASDLTSVVNHEGDLWYAGGKQGLFHSTDGGVTWDAIQYIDECPIIGLGKEAPNANYQTLYTNSKIDGQWGFYRSEDMGLSWTRINDDEHQFGAANSTITGDQRVYGRVYIGTNGRGIQYRDLK
ncbi:xyloglucanase [Thiospirochaeta perfilievii]|uniref:Xyloglucanase n=1 Tax=Thiospirochaeta perfilievii TaxID=252967 RepID=A0A5C1QAL1_9SPIO|nr:xyloglucanase [Thiospirochaeta perfilievii]QEN04378.1 xyloglucanase [Thiospirochaeta perfilievii]